MPLARVAARTDSTTRYSYNTRGVANFRARALAYSTTQKLARYVSSIYVVSLGPRPFFGEEKRPGAIRSRMREKFRKITVKSLVYVEMKYTAKVFGTRLLFHVYTRVHG